jgi:hypothetical protein
MKDLYRYVILNINPLWYSDWLWIAENFVHDPVHLESASSWFWIRFLYWQDATFLVSLNFQAFQNEIVWKTADFNSLKDASQSLLQATDADHILVQHDLEDITTRWDNLNEGL